MKSYAIFVYKMKYIYPGNGIILNDYVNSKNTWIIYRS